MPVKAVILDWDGVIYGSANREAENVLINIVKQHNHKIPDNIYERLKNNWGNGGGKPIETSFGLDPKTAQELYHKWEDYDLTHFYPLIDEPERIITKLKSWNIRVSLLTNRYRKNLEGLVNRFELASFFEFIQARDDWAFAKPDPRVFDRTLQYLITDGIKPEDCVYVGDTILDFECTKARGLISVSVLTGVFDEADFLKAGQKKENIIRSIAELPKWIEKYNKKQG